MNSPILAIDPGNKESAYVVWHAPEKRILTKGIVPNDELLNLLCVGFDDCIVMAIEMVQSFGMAVGAEVFETVFWIGRFCQEWPRVSTRIYRKDVKMFLCHSYRAKDQNIRQALIDKFGPQGTKKAPGILYGVSKHLWSALAVAVTYEGVNALCQPPISPDFKPRMMGVIS